jgi:hypothetical protein
MTTVVVYISKSTGLPFAVLRQRVPLYLTGSEVKKLISDEGEFLWLPSEYELYKVGSPEKIDDQVSLSVQGVTSETYLCTKIT